VPERKFRLRLLFQEIDLLPGRFVIGRARTCSLTIDDPLVSREHARIFVDPECAIIEDLGSRNGTKVNGKSIAERRLADGDRIRIGNYEFLFIEESPRPPAALSSTMANMICPKCHFTLPEGSEVCPSCNAVVVSSKDERARESARGDETVSSKVRTPSSIRRRSKMIDEVINMALSVEHFDKAAGFLDTQIGTLERAIDDGSADAEEIESLCTLNLAAARGLKDPMRIAWVVDTWGRMGAAMPSPLMDALDDAASGWHDLGPDLRRYLTSLERDGAIAGLDPEFVSRLKAMVRRTI